MDTPPWTELIELLELNCTALDKRWSNIEPYPKFLEVPMIKLREELSNWDYSRIWMQALRACVKPKEHIRHEVSVSFHNRTWTAYRFRDLPSLFIIWRRSSLCPIRHELSGFSTAGCTHELLSLVSQSHAGPICAKFISSLKESLLSSPDQIPCRSIAE